MPAKKKSAKNNMYLTKEKLLAKINSLEGRISKRNNEISNFVHRSNRNFEELMYLTKELDSTRKHFVKAKLSGDIMFTIITDLLMWIKNPEDARKIIFKHSFIAHGFEKEYVQEFFDKEIIGKKSNVIDIKNTESSYGS